ncbi:MAG: GAF domain-containing protein [Leptolyngbyaceae cyanobacterium bins.59]|nr:GAF domain-containing protein [Leptolyngbyaceae cyanobacterium bins.59]
MQNSQERNVWLRRLIDRLWQSPELKSILQTAIDGISELLKPDRCCFLWYFTDRQRIHVVYERICDGNIAESRFYGLESPLLPPDDTPDRVMGSWYTLPEAFKTATAIVQDGLVVQCPSITNTGALGKVIQLLSRIPDVNPPPIHSNLDEIGNVLLPIKVQEGWLGLVSCFSNQPRSWSLEDLDRAQVVAQQLSIAIRQAQVYEQVERQAQRERLINQITSQTRHSFDLREILTQAIAHLRDALVLDRCLLYLVDESLNVDQGTKQVSNFFWEEDEESQSTGRRQTHKHLFEVTSQACGSSLEQFDSHDPMTQWVMQHRQLLSIPDVKQDERLADDRDFYLDAQIRSSLVLPVQADGKLQAILYLNQCTHLRFWSKAEQELAKAVADQLAISIQQARLYVQTRRQMERESLLRLVSDNIHSTLELETILQTVVHKVRQLLNSDRVIIYQFTPEGGQVVLEELLGKCPSVLDKFRRDDYFLRKYTQLFGPEQVQIIHNTYTSSLSNDYLAFLRRVQVLAQVIVPVLIGSQVWGLLIVHECQDPRVWKPSDVYLLQQLASRMAIAIRQAELYDQVKMSAARAESKAEELERALHQLQQAQSQLIQSEKMSSLGQLVAGVAHEINNPVNFISGNLQYATQYIEDLLSLVKLYQQYYPDPVPEVQAEIDEIELEFLQDDLPKLFSSMLVGADRIRQIVLSLRSFSRLDEAEMKPVNIHDGIDSTLLILQNRLKATPGRIPIEIVKEYDELPLVECYAGQLNQVFMNVLSNAIDALEEMVIQHPDREEKPRVVIRTEQLNSDRVVVRVIDNGPGMSEEVRRKLFDPFFTTKEVGKGTGLGMSISYKIIAEKHGGILRCWSEPGNGAEFWIEIPIQQTSHEASSSAGVVAA